MKRLFLIITITLIFRVMLYADVVVYLKSNVTAKEIVTVEDIALVDGDEAGSVKKLNISSDAIKDGYITRNEVYQSLKNVVSGVVVVHGSAVKLIQPEVYTTDSSFKELSPIIDELSINKGDFITVKLIKKSIIIETIGKALQSGKTGDEIKISLQNGKIVTGKIVNNGVECFL